MEGAKWRLMFRPWEKRLHKVLPRSVRRSICAEKVSSDIEETAEAAAGAKCKLIHALWHITNCLVLGRPTKSAHRCAENSSRDLRCTITRVGENVGSFRCVSEIPFPKFNCLSSCPTCCVLRLTSPRSGRHSNAFGLCAC